MIYSILQFSWWAVCLSLGCVFSMMWWIVDKKEHFYIKLLLSANTIFIAILIGAIVQGLFTWLGNLFH